MSTCTDPMVTSSGWMFLRYAHVTQSILHKTHIRIGAAEDPGNDTIWFPIAMQWGDKVAGILTAKLVITGYGMQRSDGTVSYENVFAVPKLGVHTEAAGALDYKSRTLTFTGRGKAPTINGCNGEALSRVFVAGAQEFIPGQKFMSPGSDPAVDALAAWLAGQTRVWCDFYGQHAGVRGSYPVQFNARTQRKYGT